MAHAKERREKGVPTGRFTAVYAHPSGGERSAGTFDDRETAERVAREMEEFARSGVRGVSPEQKATMTIAEYFPTWVKNLAVERSTKANYRDMFACYVEDRFGTVRVAELRRDAVRVYLAELRERGLRPSTQRGVRSLISGMMRDAVDDGYREDNPVRGLRVEKRRGGTRKITVLTTKQFNTLFKKLPSDGARLLAQVLISAGCRQCEAFVLTPADINFETCEIEFNKSLQTIDKEDSPDGESTYYVGPVKTHDVRTVDVDPAVIEALAKWIANLGIGDDDLVFPREVTFPRRRATSVRLEKIVLTPELIETLGTKTAPNGREYKHGTMNCYVTAKCRECDYCRQAFADYRYNLEQHKSQILGHSYGTKAARATTCPFVTPSMWRDRFKTACKEAELAFVPTAYQLRHTHASWLIENGESPKKVMERLGHTSLSTTQVYVHQVENNRSSSKIMQGLGLDWDVA